MANSSNVTPHLPYDIICCILHHTDFQTLKNISLISRSVQEAADRFLWKHTNFVMTAKLIPYYTTEIWSRILQRARTMSSLRLTTPILPSQMETAIAHDPVQCTLTIIDELDRLTRLQALTLNLQRELWSEADPIIRRFQEISAGMGKRLKALHISLPQFLKPDARETIHFLFALHPSVKELSLDFSITQQTWGDPGSHLLKPKPVEFVPWRASSLPYLEKLLCQDLETPSIAAAPSHPSPLREIYITRAHFVKSSNMSDSIVYNPLDRFIPLLSTFSATLLVLNIELFNSPGNSSLHLPVLLALLRDAVPALPLLQTLQVDNAHKLAMCADLLPYWATEEIVASLALLSSDSSRPSSLSRLGFAHLGYDDTREFAGRMFDSLKSLKCVRLDELDELQWELGEPATPKMYKRVDGKVVETTEPWVDIGEDD